MTFIHIDKGAAGLVIQRTVVDMLVDEGVCKTADWGQYERRTLLRPFAVSAIAHLIPQLTEYRLSEPGNDQPSIARKRRIEDNESLSSTSAREYVVA